MGRTRRSTLLAGLGALVLGLAGFPAPATAAVGVVVAAPAATAVPGHYLVLLKDGASAAVAAGYDGTVDAVWRRAVNGFAISTDDATARKLAANPSVAGVYQDSRVTVADTQPNPPSWGLNRIDQHDLPLSGGYTHATTAGNVRAYIIDTGISTTHTTFGGRASWGYNAVDSNNTDCNGHGTHVAGTVGGSQYGVAKEVRLVAVKVLNCAGSGTFAQVVSGVDWVTAHAVKPAVANMSLGAPASASTVPLENAIRTSIASGVTYAIASGNSSANACGYSPANVAQALTVNSSTITDARSSFSNYGSCTDLFAPGEDITSSWIGSTTASNTISGTSMATPHVAGTAALYLSRNPSASPAAVHAAITGAATPNKITNPGVGSPNLLLYSGFITAPAGRIGLTRYLTTSAPSDHMLSTGTPPPGYAIEGFYGYANIASGPGTHPIYRCKYFYDTFTSNDANCEGQQILGLIGYLHNTQPPGGSPIYRCLVTNVGEHFDSADANCEGHISEGLTGWAQL